MTITLLPAEHEAPPCAAFTRGLKASSAGTALALDRILLVAEPGPWPKPALSAPSLKPLVAPLTASPIATRLFAAEPPAGASSGRAQIEVYERDGVGATVARFSPETADELADPLAWASRTVERIAQTPHGMLEGEAAGPALLVCTQGTHDNCCGVHGQALAALIESQYPDVVLRRVSHTGGHRFAPTIIALPSGRMWAWVDAALLARVLDGAPTADDLASSCRGWWGAAKGAAQVAELAARIQHGRPFTDAPTIALSSPSDSVSNEGSVSYEVVAGPGRWSVIVEEKRAIPTIACEAPGGLPAKQTVEYGWSVTEFTS